MKLLVYSPSGISTNYLMGSLVRRIPFGFHLVPAGLMVLGLLTVKESRLARAPQPCVLREEHLSSEISRREMVEIEAAIEEEKAARNLKAEEGSDHAHEEQQQSHAKGSEARPDLHDALGTLLD